ncbi:MAG: TonB-dependent receptor domain-containing protein [bacterium]
MVKKSYAKFVYVLYLLVVVCILVIPVQASAQKVGTITGTIITSEASEPLPGANVTVVGTMRGASTNVNGVYTLNIEPGAYTIRASFIGYGSVEKKVRIAVGETVTIDFELAESPVEFGESLVVLGSRTARTAIETPVPVDVISATEVRQSGQLEINQVLTYLAPSFNASHQTIGDGTDHVNPASLRGLGPDQVLVLVNGKRRHQSALVHVNGTFGRGTVGVDLNSIPKAAIKRIEILRDGAAAQYGSDAIAGVINIVLKEQTNNIEINSMTGTTGEGDGDQITLDANYGFRIGDRGFFNVTGEFYDRGRTNRSETFQGSVFFSDKAADNVEITRRGLTRDDFSMKTGQAKATVGMVFFNSAYSLSENAELYSYGGFSHRKGVASGFYRRPIQEERVVFEIFPNGFLPEIDTEIVDQSFTAGLRGDHNGWDIDLSVTHGENSFQFNIENTVNASLGTASPLSFDAGRLKFRQTTGNLDIVRPIETKGAVNSFSLTFGGEFRIENYQIRAGQFESYSLGNGGDRPGVDFDTTSTGTPKAAGSQVFPGFQPSNEVNRFRNSISVYGGIETEVSDQFMIDIGGRFENFNDFGKRIIGKAAARFEPVENFALRGALSTGFRAPSLHQAWFNNVSTQFLTDTETGELVPRQVLTANNKSSVTKAFGIPNLKEETSINVSAGFTARPHPKFSVTADFYHITIDDRIVLTSRFTDSNPTFATILAPFKEQGVTQAQFFSNAVDTETNGVDIVAGFFTPVGRGKLNLTFSANFTDTNVDKVNIPQESIDLFEEAKGGAATKEDLETIANTLFNREEFNRLEDALPRQKINFSARYSIGAFSVLGRASYFGKVEYKPTSSITLEDGTKFFTNDETFDGKALFDLDVSYEFVPGVRFSLGANNIFNTFPDEHGTLAERQAENPNLKSNRGDGNFVYSRRVTQFGMNGGFYYGRLSFNL